MNNNKKLDIKMNNLINQLYELIKKKFYNFFSSSPIKLILIISITLGIIIYLFKNIIINLINNIVLRPNITILKLSENIPFLAYIKNKNGTSYINFYKQFLSRYYNKYIKSIDETILNKIDSSHLNSQSSNTDTYNFWIYLSSNNSGLTQYFMNNEYIKDRIKNYNINNLFDTLNSNRKRLIFSRTNGVYEYPSLYLIKNKLYIYVKITDDRSKNYDISGNTNINIEYNKWNNITITLKYNVISLYKNGKLEKVYTIDSGNKALKQNKNYPLYILRKNDLDNNYVSGYANNEGTFDKPHDLDSCLDSGDCLNDGYLKKFTYYTINNSKYYILNDIKCENSNCISGSNCDNYIKSDDKEFSVVNKETLTTEFHGFEGYLNNFKYYNIILNQREIEKIYNHELKKLYYH